MVYIFANSLDLCPQFVAFNMDYTPKSVSCSLANLPAAEDIKKKVTIINKKRLSVLDFNEYSYPFIR